MSFIKNTILGAFAASLMGTSAIAAPDPEAVADRVTEILEMEGGKASYDQVVYNPVDDIITILNVQHADKKESFRAGVIAIKGYDEDNTTGLGATRITFTDTEVIVEDEFRAYVGQLHFDDVNIESFEDAEDPVAVSNWLGGIELGGLSVTDDKDNTVSLASMTLKNGIDGKEMYSGRFNMNMNGLNIPTDMFDDEAKVFFEGINQPLLSLEIALDMEYDADDQNFDLSTLFVSAEDLGSLKMDVELEGIAPEILMNPEEIQGLMATAAVRGAHISFENSSVFEKGLDFAGKMTGQGADGLKSQAPLLLGMGLSQLNNEEFSKMVTEAVTSFLDNPKNLNIAVDPENAIPVAQIAGAAMAAPGSIPNMLGLEVSANK